MYRSEVVLNDKQKELLDVFAFMKSQKEKRRITRSSLIRECINYWWENKGKQEMSDSELVLLNQTLLGDILSAKEDLQEGREYSHEEMLKELSK